jgi:hypothetical protein
MPNQHNDDRLSLERCRAKLGPEADGMTDAQVLQLRDSLYMLAGIVCNEFEKTLPRAKEKR